MFLHTVLSGLQSDNIKRNLKPYLEQTDISDELLLEWRNAECAYEAERHNYYSLSSNAPVEKKEKLSVQQNLDKMSPSLKRWNLKWLYWKISKLKYPKLVSLCNSPNTHPHCTLQREDQMAHQFSNSQVNRCRTHCRGTGSLLAPDKGGRLPSISRSLPLSEDFSSLNLGRLRRCFSCRKHGAKDYWTHCYRCGSSEPFLAGCLARGQRPFGGDPLYEERLLARNREWLMTQQGPSIVHSVDKRAKG